MWGLHPGIYSTRDDARWGSSEPPEQASFRWLTPNFDSESNLYCYWPFYLKARAGGRISGETGCFFIHLDGPITRLED